ncbi:MAG TPA: hypothetical protein VIF09_22130 [Polyangiaceae bacterium]
MDERRAYLKQLAARSARRWSATPLPECFAGETRIETRNTCYQLRDGVCHAVSRQQGSGPGRCHPSEFVGMRIVGWLLRDAPTSGVTLEWQPGAYAVLWRQRADREHSAVALTSTSVAFRPALRTSVPPPLPHPVATRSRSSTPPPLPFQASRSTFLPQPVTPPSWIPPAPGSMTRLHMEELRRSEIPLAPETPTPARRSTVPPPLPPLASGRRPMPLRIPVHG